MKNFIVIFIISALTSHAWAEQKQVKSRSQVVQKKQKSELREEEESKISVRPSFDFVTISPSELNNYYSNLSQKLGIVDQYKISGGTGFSISGDYSFTENFSLGLRLDYFSASSNTVQLKNGAARANFQSSLSALPLYLTATYKYPIPAAPKFSVGAVVGAGIPLSYHLNTEITGSNIEVLPNGTATYSATPLSGFGSIFGSYDLAKTISTRLEFGYRFVSSDNMKLNDNYGFNDKAGDLLKDDSGSKVNVSASSFFVGAGVSATF